MSDPRALAEIKRLTQRGWVRYTWHARERMAERGAKARDVESALLTATSATWQVDKQNWRVEGGVDTDRDDLTVIVDLEADVVVVTIL